MIGRTAAGASNPHRPARGAVTDSSDGTSWGSFFPFDKPDMRDLGSAGKARGKTTCHQVSLFSVWLSVVPIPAVRH